jgi:hypothetical protein
MFFKKSHFGFFIKSQKGFFFLLFGFFYPLKTLFAPNFKGPNSIIFMYIFNGLGLMA